MTTQNLPQKIIRKPSERPPEGRFLDARTLVVRGFLSRRLTVLGSVLSLKSINSHEFEEIRDWVPEALTRSEVFRHNLYYMAYSVFKIDGQTFLTDRSKSIPYLVEQFGKWPRPLVSATLQLLAGFSHRYRIAMTDVKFWFAQEEARARWMATKGISQCDPSLTGVAGTQNLGLNELQIMWSFLNAMEDRRQTDITIMAAGRLAATATNPKGMRTVNARMEAHDSKAEQYLANLRRGVDSSGTFLGQPVSSPETTEELLEEVRKSQAGIKDQHDLIIEEYEKGIREQLEGRVQALADRSKRQVEVDGEILDPGMVNSSAPLVVTEEQMRDMMKASKTFKPASPNMLPIDPTDERVEKVVSMLGGTGQRLATHPTATPDDMEELPPALGYEKGEDSLGDYQGPGRLKRPSPPRKD